MDDGYNPFHFNFTVMTKRAVFPLLTVLLLFSLSVDQLQAQLARVSEATFGNLPDGREVRRYTLQNRNGMVVKVINYGAIITDVQVPDRDGKMTNVVVGNDTLENYLRPFPAAIVIGRFANRIGNARFTLDGQTYAVTPNLQGKHHIHGGRNGFSKQLWTPEVLLAKDDMASLTLSYSSPDGEEGYPGNLITRVTYSLTDSNELILDYEAATDRPTVVNLTNHAYFDLSGSSDISGHLLQLNADHYTLTDDELIPTGAIAPVEKTPLDFREATLIGARTQDITGPRPNIYDHNFIINNGGTGLVKAAEVYYSGNGRAMEVRTTMPGVQLFTGNKRGFCLETQQFPDAVNHPHFPSPVVRPDRPFVSKTVFAFSVR